VVNEYARLAAIRFNGAAEIVWEYEDELSEVASPLAAGELLFQATSYGTVSCFAAETGEVLWSHEFDEGFYSSPMLAGGRVYLMDMDGVTHVFRAAAEYELLAQNELGEDAMTIPAFMHDRIYIRGMEHLFCIGK
jgi:outer membrane protein assembly factor BamB